MKHYIIFIASLLLIGCSNPSNIENEKNDSISYCIENAFVHVVDSFPNTSGLLRVYYPTYSNIDLFCGDEIDDGTIANQAFCAAAAYTGKGWKNGFSHSLIAGKHVSHGVLYDGYPCKNNTGAFVWYNGCYSFLYKEYANEFVLAANTNHGCAFAQEMLIHHREEVPTERNKNDRTIYRALCEIEDPSTENRRLCVVESKRDLKLKTFIQEMIRINVTEALYLDMGEWSYCWYRDILGNVIHTFPKEKERLSNAIVFLGVN